MLAKLSAYYVLRILQRVSLLYLIMATAVHWMIWVSITALVGYQGAMEQTYKHPADAQATITHAINMSAYAVVGGIAWVGIMTIILFISSKARREDGKLFADSLAVVVFCLLATVFAQLIVRNFVGKLAGL